MYANTETMYAFAQEPSVTIGKSRKPFKSISHITVANGFACSEDCAKIVQLCPALKKQLFQSQA